MPPVFAEERGVVPFCTALGVPPHLVDDESVRNGVYPAFLHLFTGGEFGSALPGFTRPDPDLRVWFGTTAVDQGLFAQRLAVVVEKPGPLGDPLQQLQGYFAMLLARELATGEGPLGLDEKALNLRPTVAPAGSVLHFGNEPEARGLSEDLGRPIERILEISPGVVRTIGTIRQLWAALPHAEEYPLRHLICDNAFLSSFAVAYPIAARHQRHDEEVVDLLSDELLRDGAFLPMTGDPVQVTAELAAERYGGEHGVDVIVCPVPASPASADRTARLLVNCRRLLRPGGALLLLVRPGPAIPDRDGAGDPIARLMEQSARAGFPPAAVRVERGIGPDPLVRVLLRT